VSVEVAALFLKRDVPERRARLLLSL
jgi:hypothetical protein